MSWRGALPREAPSCPSRGTKGGAEERALFGWTQIVAAIYTAVKAIPVGVAAVVVVRIIRPIALNLPLAAVAEGEQGRTERPRALVAILLAGTIIPATVA